MTKESYLYLRKVLGILGMLLAPLSLLTALIFGPNSAYPVSNLWYSSISITFYSNAGPIMIGLLVATGIFLITYTGYNTLDNVLCTIAGIASIGIAFFPCENNAVNIPVGIFNLPINISTIIHSICAGVFFGILSFNSIFLFTKTDQDIVVKGTKKWQRNLIYRICGIVMAISMVVGAISGKFGIPKAILMVAEWIALTAFGISWLVKGDVIKALND